VAEYQGVAIIRLDGDDWQTYRAIRLAMLQDSPSAFGGTHDEAARNEEHVWKRRLTDNTVLLARVWGGTGRLGDVLGLRCDQTRRLLPVRDVG